MKESELLLCKRMAKAVAQQFGTSCEVVVHDLEGEHDHSIVAIENGHVSGRKLGDGPSRVVLQALQGDSQGLEDRLAYLTKTEDGKILKSSTVYIRDEDGKAVGIFAINYDVTLLTAADAHLRGFLATEAPSAAEPEPIPQSVTALLDELIAQSVRLVGKPAALMSKEEKIKAIGFLNDSGAFLITKSGVRVCSHFGISKYTLYSYLDEAKGDKKAT